MIDGDFCIYSDLFFMWSENNVVPINMVTAKDLVLNRHKLCRRIEVTERDEFIEKAFGMMAHLGDDGTARAIANDMYEAGFRLVNGE